MPIPLQFLLPPPLQDLLLGLGRLRLARPAIIGRLVRVFLLTDAGDRLSNFVRRRRGDEAWVRITSPLNPRETLQAKLVWGKIKIAKYKVFVRKFKVPKNIIIESPCKPKWIERKNTRLKQQSD